MKRDSFVSGILHGGDKSLGAALLRGLLAPLAWLHQIGLEIYLLPFRLGIRKRYRLPVPVIAIGNLTSGGTGKTPMAALLAAHLRDSGRRVALLSRGHGGSGESGHLPRIVSDGEHILLTPTEAGDEPVLLARLLPNVPVVIGRDRRASGRLAVERFAPEILVCDDALQYWQLERDLNIVLLDARRPFDNGCVLPRGLLREPPSHLARAGIVVLTRADRATPADLAAAKAQITRYAPNAPLFAAIHAPLGWIRAAEDGLLPINALRGKSALAFSGIADSAAFIETVRSLGVTVAETSDFGDHHAYTAEDAARLARSASLSVTTEKDLVKVATLWPENGPPLYALRVGMKIENEAEFFSAVSAIAYREIRTVKPSWVK